MKRIWSSVVAAGCLSILLGSCAGWKVARTSYDEGVVGWPPGEHRVRLVSVVELHRNPARGRFGPLPGVDRTATPPRFLRPYAVTWLGNDLLLTDPDGGRVARVAGDGKVTFSPEKSFRVPVGIASCSAGILVTDAEAGSVSVLDENLERTGFLARDLERPTGIACDGDTVYVVETGNHRVLVYEAGNDLRTLGSRGARPGLFNYPTSVAVRTDPAGSVLLVGDSMNFRVQVLDPESGSSSLQFGRLGDAPGEMPRIKGVAFDAGGRLWVSDAHLDRVSLYDAKGGLLISVGNSGSEPGEFAFPAGVAAHADGRVAVVDSYNRRIQILRVEDTR